MRRRRSARRTRSSPVSSNKILIRRMSHVGSMSIARSIHVVADSTVCSSIQPLRNVQLLTVHTTLPSPVTESIEKLNAVRNKRRGSSFKGIHGAGIHLDRGSFTRAMSSLEEGPRSLSFKMSSSPKDSKPRALGLASPTAQVLPTQGTASKEPSSPISPGAGSPTADLTSDDKSDNGSETRSTTSSSIARSTTLAGIGELSLLVVGVSRAARAGVVGVGGARARGSCSVDSSSTRTAIHLIQLSFNSHSTLIQGGTIAKESKLLEALIRLDSTCDTFDLDLMAQRSVKEKELAEIICDFASKNMASKLQQLAKVLEIKNIPGDYDNRTVS